MPNETHRPPTSRPLLFPHSQSKMSQFTRKLNTAPTVPAVRRTLAQRFAQPVPTVPVPRAPKTVTGSIVTAPHHYAKTTTVNEAGGKAFRKSSAFELVTLIFTTLLAGKKGPKKFYTSEAQTISRLQTLVSGDPFFAAQCAVYARRVLGLRSVTHAVAAMVVHATKGSGQPWVRQFVQSVIYRPDDAIEIVAAYIHFYGGGKSIRKPAGKRGKRLPVTLPYPLKKGIAAELSKLDAYQLAKYQKSDQAITLADLFNLTHPVPTAENAANVKAFIRGELKNEDTWEARLSAAGSSVVAKEEAWCGLLETKKLGYFAALRNLRNILQQAPGAVDATLALLTNQRAIQRSLVLPTQFSRAYQEVKISGLPRAAEAAAALERAIEISCSNIPVLPGKTLVCLDESGSMGGRETDLSPANVGSLFAGVVLKSQPNADFMAFSTGAQYVHVNKSLPLYQLVGAIRSNWHGGSTNFHAIFDAASTKYDNIIVLSDQEGWTLGQRWDSEMGAPTSARRRYEQKFGTLPFIVVFDLQGANSMMFPEDSVATLAGFSDKVFTLLQELRKNPSALVTEVGKMDFAAINAGDEED